MDVDAIRKDILNGNDQFLIHYYHESKRLCIGYLIKRNLCSSDEAEDIYAESIIILRDNIIQSKLKHSTNIKAYLKGICHNLAVNSIKKKVKESEKSEQVRLLFYENNYSIVESEELEHKKKICQKALATISKNCQRVLTLFYVHNLSMIEIAKEMNFSGKDVAKSTKSRCYKKWIEQINQMYNLSL